MFSSYVTAKVIPKFLKMCLNFVGYVDSDKHVQLQLILNPSSTCHSRQSPCAHWMPTHAKPPFPQAPTAFIAVWIAYHKMINTVEAWKWDQTYTDFIIFITKLIIFWMHHWWSHLCDSEMGSKTMVWWLMMMMMMMWIWLTEGDYNGIVLWSLWVTCM